MQLIRFEQFSHKIIKGVFLELADNFVTSCIIRICKPKAEYYSPS